MFSQHIHHFTVSRNFTPAFIELLMLNATAHIVSDEGASYIYLSLHVTEQHAVGDAAGKVLLSVVANRATDNLLIVIIYAPVVSLDEVLDKFSAFFGDVSTLRISIPLEDVRQIHHWLNRFVLDRPCKICSNSVSHLP